MVSKQLIQDYIDGKLGSEERLEMFAELVRTEQYLDVPSEVRRNIIGCINAGYIDLNGNINWERFDNR